MVTSKIVRFPKRGKLHLVWNSASVDERAEEAQALSHADRRHGEPEEATRHPPEDDNPVPSEKPD